MHKSPPARLARSPIRRNFASLLAGELTNKAFRLVAAIVLARTLTLEEFGLLNVGIAVSGIAVVATTLGLNDVGIRDVAVEPEGASRLAGRVVALRLVVLAAVVATAVPLVVLFAPGRLGLVLAAAAMALAMTVSLEWVLRGLEQMGRLAFAWILGGVTVLVCSIVAVSLSKGAALALTAFAAGETAVALTCWLAVRRSVRPQFGFSGGLALLRRSWPVALSGLVIYSYYANADTLILAAVRSAEEAGLYSAAYRAFLVLNLVGAFAAVSVQPTLSRRIAAGDERGASEDLLRVLRVLACYGALVLGLSECLAEPFLGLVFGERFEAMATTFILLCTAVAWYSVGYPAGYSLIAANRNRRFLLGAGVAGILNLGLNLALIPAYGAEGAGLATAVAFAVATVTWMWARPELMARAASLLVSVALASAGGVLAASLPDVRTSVGALTAAIALVAALRLRSTGRGPDLPLGEDAGELPRVPP